MKSRAWQFGSFLLVPAEHTLLRDGVRVRLARKDFDLLVILVERAGQLVRKEELLHELWPDAFVEDGNLTKHVSTLRKALGQAGDAGPVIETVPKTGFRFVAPVIETDRTNPPLPRRRSPWWRLAAVVTFIALLGASALMLRGWRAHPQTPPSGWKALAVLPFTPLEGQSEPVAHLGIGLADGIITRLSSQRMLPVRPTSQVRGYAGALAADVRTVGNTLAADVVLEGHVQRAGDLVRVTVQLSDVRTGAPIWGETFDQPMAELFKLEDAIADRVAGALRLQIGAAEQERLRRRYTQNGAAYDAYLAGRDALLQYTPDSTRSAVASFERALTLDSGYALARAGLAMASADMYLRFASAGEQQQWGERAESEARAALALDPDLAEAHAARAAVLRKREFDWDQAIAESRRALTLNPNLEQPHLVQAAAFYHLGLMERARAELDAARRAGVTDRVEPLRVDGLIALFSGEFQRARPRLEDVSRQSSRAIGDAYLALTYFYCGETRRAVQMLETLAADSSASTASRSGAALAGVLAASRELDAARRHIDDVLQRPYRDHHVAYNLGAAYAQLGDAPNAIKWLRSSAETGFPCAIWYARDPLLEPLRANPQFKIFLAELDGRQVNAASRYRE